MNVTSAVQQSPTVASLATENEGKVQNGKFLAILQGTVNTEPKGETSKLPADLLQQIQQILQQLQKLLKAQGKSGEAVKLLNELNNIFQKQTDHLTAVEAGPVLNFMPTLKSSELKAALSELKQQVQVILKQLLNNELSGKSSGALPEELQQKIKNLSDTLATLLQSDKSTKKHTRSFNDLLGSQATLRTNKQESQPFLQASRSAANESSKANVMNQMKAMLQGNGTTPVIERAGLSQQHTAGVSFESGPMSRLQQFVMHVEKPGSTHSQQQFVREFAQILSRGRLTANGTGQQQLTIKLYPEHLGTIDVKLVNNRGQLTATILTQTSVVKDLVDAQLHQLRNAFAGQNLQVDKLEVLHSQQHQAYDKDEDGSGREDHEDQKDQGSKNSDEDEQPSLSFLEWLEDHLT